MFRALFRTRTLRTPRTPEHFFRPSLEYLEGRLAPSGVGPMDDRGPHGPPGPPSGPPGPPPPANVHINAHDSYNTTITDSFNTSINNVVVNQYLNVAAAPSAQVQQTFSTGVGMAAQINFPALLSLATDEFQLAADTCLSLTAGGQNNATLTQNMHNLQLDIQSNPLEATPLGQLVGNLAFDVALSAMVSANAQTSN